MKSQDVMKTRFTPTEVRSMTRVALYARVSTTGQNTENQIDELRRYSAARGWSVAEEYVDAGVSGAKTSRPALDRLMKDATARHFDAVAVWKLDRFGRSVLHLTRAVAELDAAGVRFVAISQGIDTDHSNPTGRLLFNILSSIAQFERELINERITLGVDRARRTGTKSGKPWGRPKAADAATTYRAVKLREEGRSFSEIVAATGLKRSTVVRLVQKGCARAAGETVANESAAGAL